MTIAKSSRISLTAFFYSIRINDQWRIVFKFENVVAENVRIADIHIRLIDYHKTDMRKNCEAILCGGCIQLATTRTQKTMAAHSCERIAKQFFAVAASNQQCLGHKRTPAAPCARIALAILGDAAANQQCLEFIWTTAALSWHNMSACTVSPGSGRGQRSRIRQAPSSPRRRSRSRIVQGSF